METRKTTRGSSLTRLEKQVQESVLVVDDDVRVIELLQITLTGRGYSVQTAFDGEAALEEIRRGKPDLLVLDVRLPRKSGFQVLETIRADEGLAHLPVILISGNSSNEARIQGLRLGADDFLIKPFSPRELIMKIRRILDRVSDQKLLQSKNQLLEAEVCRQREQVLAGHSEMQRNLLKIGTVLQRVEQINEQRSMARVLDGFLHSLISDIGLQAVCFFLRDGKERTFRPEVWRGIKDTVILNLAIPEKGFLFQVLALEGRTMSLDEFGDYPRAADDLLRLSSAGFTHMTPVRQGGDVVALMVGGDKADGQALDALDVHLLSLLARSAATAIQNALCFDEVRKSFVVTVTQLVAAVESRYDGLAGHSSRVNDLALRIADCFGLAQSVRQTISYAALLHDLGALEEYEELFEAQRVLSDEERIELRRRASGGVRLLLENSHMPDVAEAVYHLHEYWDGTGLPDALAGESIPLAARIVAAANAFEALTHTRPHRAAYSPEDAQRIIQDRAGHQFDPEVVDILPRALEMRPPITNLAASGDETA